MKGIKNVRLKHYDYASNGYYFVTICTNNRTPCLTGQNKKVVAQVIERIPEKGSGVAVDYYVIMPTHLHIIFVLQDCRLMLGEIVRRLKAATTRQVGFSVWQPNYYEHVVRSEKALGKIREYIINNPSAEKIDFAEFY